MAYWVTQLLEFVADYRGLLSAAAAVWLYNYAIRIRMSPALGWSLFGVYLAISFRNWRKEKERDAEMKAAAKKPEAARRVYVTEPAALLAHLRDPRRLARMELVRYCEKWLTLSGTVEGVAESLAGDAIYLTLILERGQRVNLRFAADDREEIEELRIGQTVNAAGQIKPDFPRFALENCELLRVTPVGVPLARVS